MSALVAPVHTGTLNDQPLRFFKAHLQGPHLPWHAAEDLYRCLALPRELRRHFQQQLRSSEWRDRIRTVATADGIVTICPHFVAQGLIGAMQDVGRADALTEMRYAAQAKEAWDRTYPGGDFGEALSLLLTAVRNEGGGSLSASSDFLGRMWPHEKLDRLLADPGVMAAIEEMDCAGREPDRGRPFQAKLARAWAEARGRSEPAFALLLLLRWRWFTLSSRRSV